METNFTLQGLLNLIERWDRFPAVLGRLRSTGTVGVAMAEGAKPYLLAALQQRLAAPILVVTARPGRARDLAEQIALWSSDPDRVLLVPRSRLPALRANAL